MLESLLSIGVPQKCLGILPFVLSIEFHSSQPALVFWGEVRAKTYWLGFNCEEWEMEENVLACKG